MTSGNDEFHESSCSVHNMPAYPNGPCDCKRCLRYREENSMTAIEWTQKQIRECFSGVRKVKGKVVKRRDHLTEEALDKAVEACRLSDH